jgi:hypothetical protein
VNTDALFSRPLRSALDPRARLGIQLIAVRDARTGDFELPPEPGTAPRPSDSLVLAGSDAALAKLATG